MNYLEDLLREAKKSNVVLDEKLFERIMRYASEKYSGKKRASGEEFIIHPIEVAKILIELKMDQESIAAGILHDVIEDTNSSKEELGKLFGEEIAGLVEGVTKIHRVKQMSIKSAQAENLEKLLVGAAKDYRIIIVKIADRLHNIRTIHFLPKKDRIRIARETMYIYAPIAKKLGLQKIVEEMQDNSFKQLKPEAYDEIEKKLAESKGRMEKRISKTIKTIKTILNDKKIEAKVYGRVKSIYSTYKKLQRKNFDDIEDITAITVLAKDVNSCYEILGIIHTLWPPVGGRFKDYIAVPKPTGYQAIHTTVLGIDNFAIEVQIKTPEMLETAELGKAAHWRYKGHEKSVFDRKLVFAREVLEAKKKSKNAAEFVDIMRIGFSDDIYVFTPKGDAIQLPANATPLDFAFAVHTDLGFKTDKAKVNGNIVPLDCELGNGDLVEITVNKKREPSRAWVGIVKSNKAKMKLRKYFDLKPGTKKTVEREQKTEIIKPSPKPKSVDVCGEEGSEVRYAGCCAPIPGDKIIAFKLKNNSISVHRADCRNLEKYGQKKRVKAEWKKDCVVSFDVKIRVYGDDRPGFLVDLLNNIKAEKGQVKNISSKVDKSDRILVNLVVGIRNNDHLDSLIDRMSKVRSAKNVYRA